jgi:hypothetical protein
MATFPRWKELGRHVRKGEKAITLCQPVTVKRPADADDETSESRMFTRFVYRPKWFVLAQTDGAEIRPVPIPSWDATRALSALDVTEAPFDATDGNVLGFARSRTIAVNPVNPLPHKTRFHELAHVLLGHTAEGAQADGEITPRSDGNARRNPWPCRAAPHWICPASSSAAATFKTGGVRGIRSQNGLHSGYSRRPISLDGRVTNPAAAAIILQAVQAHVCALAACLPHPAPAHVRPAVVDPAAMTDAELYAYYKRTALTDDLRFFLRGRMSDALQAGRHDTSEVSTRRDRFVSFGLKAHLPSAVHVEPVAGIVLVGNEGTFSSFSGESRGYFPLAWNAGIVLGADFRIGGRHLAFVPGLRFVFTGVPNGTQCVIGFSGEPLCREGEPRWEWHYPRWTQRPSVTLGVHF